MISYKWISKVWFYYSPIYKLAIGLDVGVVFALHNDTLFESRAGGPEDIYKIVQFALVDLSVSLTPGTKGRHAELSQSTI
jgi:hypothetical protein